MLSRQWFEGLFIKYSLSLSIVLITFTFFITRTLFYYKYAVPIIDPDTYGYVKPALALLSKDLPVFLFRTPGVPLLIFIGILITKSIIGVVFFQTIISLAASISILLSVYTSFPNLAIPTSIAICAYNSIACNFSYDFRIGSESLYASCLLFSIAFLILSVY